jgi:hypothetical protein
VEHDGLFVRGLAFLLGFVTALPAVAFAQADAASKPCTHPQLSATANVRGYAFKAYEDTDGDTSGCVRIYFHDKLVYQLQNDHDLSYRLGQAADPANKIPLVPDGSDLTGNGRTDMMVTGWSGGAHCCFTHYIFELEPKLRLIANLYDGDTNLGHFEYLDHDRRYSYIATEIWSYWPDSFAASVSHKVILRWNGKKFALDLDRMRFPPPSPQQWQSALNDVDEAVKDGDRGSLGLTLWDTTLDLIYSGHSDLAWKFVSEANPKALRGGNPTLNDFCAMLKTSDYWPDLRPTLKDVPEDCASAKGAVQKTVPGK